MLNYGRERVGRLENKDLAGKVFRFMLKAPGREFTHPAVKTPVSHSDYAVCQHFIVRFKKLWDDSPGRQGKLMVICDREFKSAKTRNLHSGKRDLKETCALKIKANRTVVPDNMTTIQAAAQMPEKADVF